MTLDIAAVQLKLARLDEEVGELSRLRPMSDEVLHADPERLPGVGRRLQVAIEACVDIGRMTLAARKARVPDTIAETFVVLGEIGAIDRDFVPTLVEMAKFRNRLVHLYADVTDKELISALRTGISDLMRFRSEIGRYLDA